MLKSSDLELREKASLDTSLISNFRRVPNVVCFLLGNSPASEFYIPTFRNTLFHLHWRIGVKDDTDSSVKMEQCSETSAYKIQTLGSYQEESIQQGWRRSRDYSCITQKTRKREWSYSSVHSQPQYYSVVSGQSHGVAALSREIDVSILERKLGESKSQSE